MSHSPPPSSFISYKSNKWEKIMTKMKNEILSCGMKMEVYSLISSNDLDWFVAPSLCPDNCADNSKTWRHTFETCRHINETAIGHIHSKTVECYRMKPSNTKRVPFKENGEPLTKHLFFYLLLLGYTRDNFSIHWQHILETGVHFDAIHSLPFDLPFRIM